MENAILPAPGGSGAKKCRDHPEKEGNPVKFYDTDAYNITSLSLDQDISNR